MASVNAVTHVIFDVDGLLLDTETLYTLVDQEICQRYGKVFTLELQSQIMGTKQDQGAKVVIEQLDLPISIKEFCDMEDDGMAKILPEANLLPGAEKLVKHLHKHGVPIAIATGSHEADMVLKTRKYRDLFSLFHHSVYNSSDPDVKNGKPEPDCFLVAAQRFNNPTPDSSQCLVFEDSPNGVLAALAANMQVIWVPPNFISKSKFNLEDRSTQTLNSLIEFQPEIFGLPSYDE